MECTDGCQRTIRLTKTISIFPTPQPAWGQASCNVGAEDARATYLRLCARLFLGQNGNIGQFIECFRQVFRQPATFFVLARSTPHSGSHLDSNPFLPAPENFRKSPF